MEKETSKDNHRKHTKLTRPNKGEFAKTEFAFMGTVCTEISTFYEALKQHLPKSLKYTFVDGDHNDSVTSYSKFKEKQFDLSNEPTWNSFDDKFFNNACDLVLVNGNHYTADKQILFLDPRKEDSIKRNIHKITDLVAIVEFGGQLGGWEDKHENNVVFERVLQKYGKDIEAIPRFKMGNPKELADFLVKQVMRNVPKLKALILGGGKSQRMGQDKTQIDYHGKPQIAHLAELVNELGIETYISKRSDQDQLIDGFKEIEDKFVGLGPFGAICSALMEDPNAAWLVLASDLPFLTKSDIAKLVDDRDANAFGTAFIGEGNPFPEPLIAIYEPKIYQRLLQFLSLGYSCPRKVLINSEVNKITVDLEVIRNINTPEELSSALESIQS